MTPRASFGIIPATAEARLGAVIEITPTRPPARPMDRAERWRDAVERSEMR